jgi:hypothetical protein
MSVLAQGAAYSAAAGRIGAHASATAATPLGHAVLRKMHLDVHTGGNHCTAGGSWCDMQHQRMDQWVKASASDAVICRPRASGLNCSCSCVCATVT